MEESESPSVTIHGFKRLIYMRTILFLMLALMMRQQHIHGQTIAGVILDVETQEPLPFVNIGIPGKGIGTVAQADGSFTLRLDGAADKDTIRISMIGYATEKIPAHAWMIRSEVRIQLSPVDQQLDMVVVRPRDLKPARLGNDYDSPSVQVGFIGDSEDTTVVNPPGAELGTIMKVKKDRTFYLDSCGLNFSAFTPDSAVLRINFYQLNNDEPDILLNTQPIYVTVYKDQRHVRLDLRPYNISADNDFVMAAEWLIDLKGKEEKILFCGGFFGSGIRYRTTSLDSWKKVPVGIGMYCDGVYAER